MAKTANPSGSRIINHRFRESKENDCHPFGRAGQVIDCLKSPLIDHRVYSITLSQILLRLCALRLACSLVLFVYAMCFSIGSFV